MEAEMQRRECFVFFHRTHALSIHNETYEHAQGNSDCYTTVGIC